MESDRLISRSGRYVKQPTGYRAFIPAPLPPDPPIAYDAELLGLLSRADQAVGRLDGVTRMLTNPDLFVAMYVRREAVLSSQIEGTQSSLDDVLGFELDPKIASIPQDVEEVVNYVAAMNHGLERIKSFPLSLRLIREIHERLLQGVRGADKQPGEFRTSQNWIGPAGVPLSRATFVPPPPSALMDALGNLEQYLHAEQRYPVLIECGLVHAQFETIHPFLDGNGRVGRLLITTLLCYRGVLERPLLYLSHFLKLHRNEYYDRLSAIRERGDWEGWLRFFLRGVAETAEEAGETGLAVVRMREQHRAVIQNAHTGTRALDLLDLLFQQPLVNANLVQDRLGVAYNTANRLLGQLEELGIVNEITGEQRNRRYAYSPYIALFDDPEPYLEATQPHQVTEFAEPNTYS